MNYISAARVADYYAPALPLGGGIKRRCYLTSVYLSRTLGLSQEQEA